MVDYGGMSHPASPDIALGPAAAPGGFTRSARPTLVARFSWKIAALGFGMTSLASQFIHVGLSAPSPGQNFVSAGGGQEFFIAAVIAALAGLVWMLAWIARVPALKIDASGVRGFTLFGQRFIAWEDVTRLEKIWAPRVGAQLVVHARFGSTTGGYGVLQSTRLNILTSRIDRPLDQVIAAIRHYRPDLPVEEKGGKTMFKLIELFTKTIGRH